MKSFLPCPQKKLVLFPAICILIFFSSGKLFSQNDRVILQTPGFSYVSQASKTIGPGTAVQKIPHAIDEPMDSKVLAPTNDNCATAFNAANVLTATNHYNHCGTLQAGTVEAGEYTGCFLPAPLATVWYSFIADQPNMYLCITPDQTTGNVCFLSFGITVYKAAACFPTAANVVACLNYQNIGIAPSLLSKLNLVGLIPGQTYMVQVAFPSGTGCANNTKVFCIKLGHPSTCTSCASACGPMCVMAGPSWVPPPLCCTAGQVNQITTTCPSYDLGPPLNENESATNCYTFTAVNDTIWLQQIVFAWCFPQTYTFTYTLYTAGCGVIQSGNVFANSQVTGLVVGQTYKMCYSLTAACSWDSVVWPFAYTGSSSLPVEFVSFGAMTFSEKVKLYWATASEENCKEYILERTLNGLEFEEIARVRGGGNSTTLLNYKAFDDSPKAGTNYYRLKQVDTNGKFHYSKVIAARFSPDAPDLSIIPNPAADKALLTFSAAGRFDALIKVIDVQGKIVNVKQFKSVEGINEYSLNTLGLARGIYNVQLMVDDQNMVSRMIKN